MSIQRNETGDFNGRLRIVRERIAAAAGRVHRDEAGILLVAVSKSQPAERIREAIAAGIRDFGENYVEEAEPKIQALDPSVRWHMIGHVQGRKARRAADLFFRIHSVDSVRLARRLSRFAVESGRTAEIYLECNVSGEAAKFGWPAADRSAREALLEEWKRTLPLPGIAVLGLMTLAPYADDPELSRPVFRRLRELSDLARKNMPSAVGPELSMGMSDDFEPAVEEGATVLRIGRALFGPRAAPHALDPGR
jgi:pyridoxal phosphate enzyme (YggS family)